MVCLAINDAGKLPPFARAPRRQSMRGLAYAYCNGAGAKELRCSAEFIGQLRPSGHGRSPWPRQNRSRSPNGRSGKPSRVLRPTTERLE